MSSVQHDLAYQRQKNVELELRVDALLQKRSIDGKIIDMPRRG
jgi:hypothetical protein